jgi:hypothetical protein
MDFDFNVLHQNKWISIVLVLIISVYAAKARPTLPPVVRRAFDNPLFRILVLSLVIYQSYREPALALVISIAFTITLNMLSEQDTREGFRQIYGH